jgi:cytochrome c
MIRVLLLAGVVLLTTSCAEEPGHRPQPLLVGGDAARGLSAIRRYGCGGCHVIPGLPEARGRVGPSLRGIAARPYLAGRMTNGAGNLMTWIRTPRAIDPGTLMPELGVSEEDARDIATYLYRLGPPPTANEPTWPPSVPANDRQSSRSQARER